MLPHQTAIPVWKVQKEEDRAPFAAVRKGMIQDDEVQTVGGLGLDLRKGRLSEEALFQIAQDGQETLSQRSRPKRIPASPRLVRLTLQVTMLCLASSIAG